MGVAEELDLRNNSISDVKNACVALLTPHIPTCPEALDFIENELVQIDSLTSSVTALKNTCLGAVSDQMAGINSDFLNKCGGSALLDLADTYNKKMESVTSMAEGAFASKLDEGISEMEAGVLALNPLDDCQTLIANMLLLVLAPVAAVAAVVATVASAVGDLIGDLVNFDAIQEAITGALVAVSGLVSCGTAMLDSVGLLPPEVLALNSTMASAKSAVDYAKGIATNPADIMAEAKLKTIADNGFDTQIDNVKNNMQSRLDALAI